MKIANYFILTLLSALVLSGCKSRKTGSSMSLDEKMVTQYWDTQFGSEYLEARGKASVTSNGTTTNVSMHLKMKKDSIIWGKFSLFGIGATVLITEDSFFMVNTLKQEYMAYSNSFLNQYLGFKADISQVQNLLLGNAVFARDLYNFSISDMSLVANEGIATNTLKLNDKLRTFSSTINTQDTTQNAIVQYDQYEPFEEQLVPKMVSIDVEQGGQSLDVVLNYQNINTNIISKFPFYIPRGFVRK